jgi:hypothetical protein
MIAFFISEFESTERTSEVRFWSEPGSDAGVAEDVAASCGDRDFDIAFDIGRVVRVDTDQAGDERVREVMLCILEKRGDRLH